MGTWGFWEWLTYICIGVAALMTAFDQAVKQAPAFRRRIGRFLKLPIWSFTPFVLILVSALIIVTRHILPGSGPAVVSGAPTTQIVLTWQSLEIPANLGSLNNEDMRALAYLVSAHVRAFLEGMDKRQMEIYSTSQTPEQKAAAQLRLDADINREFRSHFVESIMKVSSDLTRRLKLRDNPVESAIPSGIISSSDVVYSAYRLTNLAQQLP